MSKTDFIFLHGFLGIPSDWADVIENMKKDFKEYKLDVDFHVPDYFNRPDLGPKNSFDKVATEFVNWIEANTKNQKKILVGYSLGGRLALHVFERNPTLFDRVICISTHPGFKASQDVEIKEREVNDQAWAESFLHDEWSQVVEKWNQQPIFKDSDAGPEREASAFRRDLLAKALTTWSLAKQIDKRSLLKKQAKKISWVVGGSDRKFIEIWQQMKQDGIDIPIEIITAAGHRVHFDNSLALATYISSFAK